MQRAGWTGHDCSRRLCPHGVAFGRVASTRQGLLGGAGGKVHLNAATPGSKNVLRVLMPLRYGLDHDLNVEVQVVSLTGPGKGFMRYKLAGRRGDGQKLHTFDIPTGVLASPANALELVTSTAGRLRRSGVLVYFDSTAAPNAEDVAIGDRYFFNITGNVGGHFVPSHHGSLHQPVECSGVGHCDRSSGKCSCPQGYTGDACSKLDCPRRCSGHGVCQPLWQFLDEEGLSYRAAFDSNKLLTCSCDSGFRGPDCSRQECPSGPDPLGGPGAAEGRDCSGRGTCDYGTGVCRCAAGFFGSRCETRTNFL